jgi:hypothetical protein
MDLQTRKLNAIGYLINLKDERIFNKIEATIEAFKDRKAPTLIPLSKDQIVTRAKRSNEDYSTGRFITQEQLEDDSKTWK